LYMLQEHFYRLFRRGNASSSYIYIHKTSRDACTTKHYGKTPTQSFGWATWHTDFIKQIHRQW
jgi:hypothetical protein